MTVHDPLDSFLFAGNQTYIAELYGKYLDDPGSVDRRWQEFFAELRDDPRAVARESSGASWAPSTMRVVGNGELAPMSESMVPQQATADAGLLQKFLSQRLGGSGARQATLDSINALMMIRAYRIRGHLLANLDPLGIEPPKPHPELDPKTYGFSEKDMDREVFINYVLGLESATVREIIDVLRATYCGTIGIEFMHIQDPAEKQWLQERVETIRNQTHFSDRGKLAILERLTEAECFEKYLDRKFTGTKRFGLDGGESLVPALEQIFKRGGQLGVQEIVIGMSHRGRLNVLANVMGKPLQAIFSEFHGVSAHPDDVQGSGDVKYHLGTSSDRVFDGQNVHLSLTANPSHLEAVNTVVLGKVRAKQRQLRDEEREKVFGLILHGDAAFAGQGLVHETLALSGLRGYRTGGTIHFIINNQIGFTTAPRFSRSSPYCSDVAKAVDAPIFHVNGDDPEAVVHCARITTEYRQRFKKDAVVDMICYRRFGHNESDEPAFTQPLMYRKIAEHPTTRIIYSNKLAREGLISPSQGEDLVKASYARMDQAFEAATGFKVNKADWLEGSWSGMGMAAADARRGKTGVAVDRLKEVGLALTRHPNGFHINPKIARQLEAKRKMIESGEGFDWATAEALAFGTLLVDGTPVRLSGQDSGRGTFSQRHSVLVNQTTEERYIPLANLRFGQAPFEVIDSPLSEAGVLGFEYGYSLAEPHMLVLWEAQFGDFANGAQVIIDQFIATGESKWLRMSGLVLLLPHGFEGQGPEHSSARIERYLQLSSDDNWQICNCTTPANYFHVLRRQMCREFRKPLILFTPKSLLRHKLCVSALADMDEGTTFHRVLWDQGKLLPDTQIRRMVMCSGKVYYDLFEEREKRGLKDVYLLRVEQLFPFPREVLADEIKRFPKAEIVWCQEEPRNMGAWHFMTEPLAEVLAALGRAGDKIRYAGRSSSASPASGSHAKHVAEQAQLVAEALGTAADGKRK